MHTKLLTERQLFIVVHIFILAVVAIGVYASTIPDEDSVQKSLLTLVFLPLVAYLFILPHLYSDMTVAPNSGLLFISSQKKNPRTGESVLCTLLPKGRYSHYILTTGKKINVLRDIIFTYKITLSHGQTPRTLEITAKLPIYRSLNGLLCARVLTEGGLRPSLKLFQKITDEISAKMKSAVSLQLSEFTNKESFTGTESIRFPDISNSDNPFAFTYEVRWQEK